MKNQEVTPRPARPVKENVLVVEDEQDLQELMKFNLSREGYRVQCASNGREALDLVRRHPPHIIVLDVLIPEIDGLEVCRALKADTTSSHIPIIMVTARSEESDVVAGLEIGADDYLTKPFSPRVLIARIRALLRRKAAQKVGEQSPLDVHGLQIHPGRHEVLAGGQPIELSFTEFRILLVLARAPGWVFSRYQIVDGVRGHDTIVTDRSVDVHIASLRKKLGDYGQLIETVRGVGYRFKA